MLPLFWLKCNIKFGPQKGTSHLDRYWAKFYRRKMWHKKGLPILDIIGQVFFSLGGQFGAQEGTEQRCRFGARLWKRDMADEGR